MTKRSERYLQYAEKLALKMAEVFDEDEGTISLSEIQEGDNLTELMHAMANVVPNLFHTQFTGEQMNVLEFNHLANKLCFKFVEKQ